MTMSSKIRVKVMKEEAIAILKKNYKKVTEILKNNPENTDFLKDMYSGELYESKRYTIDNINLNEFPYNRDDEDNYLNEYNIAIKLYESLKDLPRYILTSEGFWMWMEFEVGFKLALKLMPIESESTFLNMWTFDQGLRRGIFFSLYSREFFRVERTVNEFADDKYELTKFIFKYIYRFREFTWRINSNNAQILLPVIKAEKDLYDKYDNYKNIESQKFYAEVAKKLSLLGSIHLLDAMDNNDIYNYMYDKIEKLYFEKIENEAIQ